MIMMIIIIVVGFGSEMTLRLLMERKILCDTHTMLMIHTTSNKIIMNLFVGKISHVKQTKHLLLYGITVIERIAPHAKKVKIGRMRCDLHRNKSELTTTTESIAKFEWFLLDADRHRG